MSLEENWYVLGVYSSKEDDVASYLRSISLRVCLPLTLSVTKPRNKRKPVQIKVPVFKGLVFVRCTLNHFALILRHRHVLFLYRSRSHTPLIVPEEDIEELNRLEREQFWALGPTKQEPSGPAISIGSEYKVLLGPFTGLKGQCIKAIGLTRAVILVQGFKVEAPIKDLELLG